MGPPLTSFALFAAAAILAELLEESAGERSREPVQIPRLHLASAVYIAAIVVVGPWSAALVATVGGLAGAITGPVAIGRGLARTGAYAAATAAAGVAFELAGGDVGTLALLGDLIPLVALGAAYLTVRAVFLEVVLAREGFDPRLGTSAGDVALGAVVALLATTHPWNVVVVVPLAIAIHQLQLWLARVQRETFRALETFANIVDERDPSTYRHSVRVAAYVDGLARALRLPFSDVDRLRWAGRLHDLGKVAVDAAVLRKPDRLDRREWSAVHRHPRLSARLLQRFEFVATQARAVELHHERVDGRGYYGVRDEDLPLAAHFLIVADAFDAMTTDRPYRPGLPKEEALEEIERNLGSQFHPAVGKAFVAVQRGLTPEDVLTPDELQEIRGASASYRRRLVPGGRRVTARPDLLALGGLVTALVGLAFGEPWLAITGAAVGAAGVVFRALARTRSERLVRALRRSLHATTRDSVFAGVAAVVGVAWTVDWAGLVAWDEDGLGGHVERSRGTSGPDATALMSWLVREAESGADLIVAAGADVGCDGVVLALPLRRETSALVGFLVFEAPRLPPRHVELAFRETLDDLGLALADRPRESAELSAPESRVAAQQA
jgi:putative nucleotidyltransferase with HDIG domain